MEVYYNINKLWAPTKHDNCEYPLQTSYYAAISMKSWHDFAYLSKMFYTTIWVFGILSLRTAPHWTIVKAHAISLYIYLFRWKTTWKFLYLIFLKLNNDITLRKNSILHLLHRKIWSPNGSIPKSLTCMGVWKKVNDTRKSSNCIAFNGVSNRNHVATFCIARAVKLVLSWKARKFRILNNISFPSEIAPVIVLKFVISQDNFPIAIPISINEIYKIAIPFG